jgi:dTDP-4-dehydrorhamnose 3,5-epimerase
MNLHETAIAGLLEIEPIIFGDERGYFYETYNREKFKAAGIFGEFVQDNQSLSSEGVLRGLHFQKPPFAQGKLVRVIQGSVIDVAVDIRKGSPTFGQYHKVLLSGENKKMFWIPPGFAHGFATLEDNTIFAYKCTGFYNKESEGSLRWNDPELKIDWEIDNPSLSEKDREAPLLASLNSPFEY